jgi:hypothetical protein
MDKCAAGALAGQATLTATLDGLTATATPRRGNLLQIGPESCRIWSLLSSSGALQATLCVDDVTHLPYAFEMGSIHVLYSNWNMPLLIVAPDIRNEFRDGKNGAPQ